MLPSRTVENYLKTILQAQSGLGEGQRLVPMGQIASALGVVPGTATTMVKALADAGLVTYEPYAGTRLTSAGEKLAGMVLRRHRLIELFLVRVMGMSWTEVHAEAEQLEHAVSDRLIDLIDEMLGRPAVDPHGDPIPGPEGIVQQHNYHNLLTCPLHTPVVVTRVTDQDAEFLRFIESSDLKPGQSIQIEERDLAADSVRVKGKDDRRITIGMRAASKLLVEVARVMLLALIVARSAAAQPADPGKPDVTFKILDNSFLVEEAFNQEPGVFQNILGAIRLSESEWEAVFTQEWPLGTLRHQMSYTLPMVGAGQERGIGDVLINYRYQVLTEGPMRPAFAPRFSVILPSGSARKGLGSGVVGLQVNLPFSKQQRSVYWHWNGGVTYLPGVEAPTPTSATHSVALLSPHLAASAIWRARSMMHLMAESVLEFEESVDAAGATGRKTVFTLSPGVRGGWNVGDRQWILGAALPLIFSEGATSTALFGYLSYELPFKK